MLEDTNPCTSINSAQAILGEMPIGEPPDACIEAQRMAAKSTRDFINSVAFDSNGIPRSLKFEYLREGRNAPLVVPIPVDFMASITADAPSPDLQRRTSIPCPQCREWIEFSIRDLLSQSVLVCRYCELVLTLNRRQSGESLDALSRMQLALEQPEAGSAEPELSNAETDAFEPMQPPPEESSSTDFGRWGGTSDPPPTDLHQWGGIPVSPSTDLGRWDGTPEAPSTDLYQSGGLENDDLLQPQPSDSNLGFDQEVNSRRNSMSNTIEPQIERVGPPNPALPTSPILRATPNPAGVYCFYNGQRYSTGELLCAEGRLFQCFYGTWVDKGKNL